MPTTQEPWSSPPLVTPIPASHTTPPIITSGPSASDIDYQGAKIRWTTDESATSIVKYGRTTSYTDSIVSAAYVTSHSADIGGLDPVTLYHYRVYSADEAGNRVASSDRTFTTGSPVGKFVDEGWDFFEDAEYDSSLARFQAAVVADPGRIDAYEGLAWVHLYRYEFGECAAALEHAFGLNPGRVDCLVAASLLYQAMEDYEAAVTMARNALDQAGTSYVFAHDPRVEDEDVRYALIIALAATGDFEGALAEARLLDASIDVDPADPGTWGDYSTFEEAMIALIEELRDLV